MADKGRIYKLTDSGNRVFTWASILPSGTFGIFRTWAEALEYQGARLELRE